MGLTLGQAKSGQKRPQAPEGNQPAICVQVLDLGTHKGEFQGKAKLNRKIRISWELPEEKAVFNEEKGEEPFLISKTYNFSTNEKATFRKDLEAWRGKPFSDEDLQNFDIENLLGAGAMVQIVHNDKGYADVSTVAALPKSLKQEMAKLKPHNKLTYYSIENGRSEVFKSLPDFLQEFAGQCLEWNEAEGGESPAGEDEEEKSGF